MKCTIKNMSPRVVGIFARINGSDGRFEIAPGKEMIADNYETRIMKIYKKKGILEITPINTPQVFESEPSTLLSEETTSTPLDTTPEIIESTDIPKTLQEVKDEVEQYVEGGYIKGAWSEEDIAFLKKNYPIKGRKHCSNSLNRNESSVQKKINSMGLKKKKKNKKK